MKLHVVIMKKHDMCSRAVFSGGVSGGPKAATVVADLSETSFPGPDGELM